MDYLVVQDRIYCVANQDDYDTDDAFNFNSLIIAANRMNDLKREVNSKRKVLFPKTKAFTIYKWQRIDNKINLKVDLSPVKPVVYDADDISPDYNYATYNILFDLNGNVISLSPIEFYILPNVKSEKDCSERIPSIEEHRKEHIARAQMQWNSVINYVNEEETMRLFEPFEIELYSDDIISVYGIFTHDEYGWLEVKQRYSINCCLDENNLYKFNILKKDGEFDNLSFNHLPIKPEQIPEDFLKYEKGLDTVGSKYGIEVDNLKKRYYYLVKNKPILVKYPQLKKILKFFE